MLTESVLRALYPRADNAHIQAFVARSGETFEHSGIGAKPLRLQFFLAQLGHESGGLTTLSENLNYRAERLVQVWPKRFPSVAAARPYARNPEALANKVYAGRMGNGPESSGDGWRYRGRGYIQLTGRDAYASIGSLIGVDLVGNPDLAFAPDSALAVACGFWNWKALNPLCDASDFKAVTRRINGGENGMTDRKAWLDKVRRVLLSESKIRDLLMATAEEMVAIQRALQSKGYREIGAADGDPGPRSLAAVFRFRQDHDLGEGFIDDALKEALGITA